MKFIGNILWFVFTGLWAAIEYALLGILWCITIIGIPFGKQCFKFARLAIWPFGTTINSNFSSHPIANVIYIIFGGLFQGIAFAVIGALWCVTIIGIPFGKQCFKFAKLSFAPFGAKVS